MLLPIFTRHSEENQFQHELAALNAVSWALSQSLDLDRVLELALETTLRVVDSQAGCVFLPAQAETNEFRLRVHTGLPAELAQSIESIPCDDPDVQRIIASGEVVVSDRCGAPLELLTSDDSGAEPTGAGVWACFPLLARGRSQGLMSILVEEFTPERARLLKSIGQHVGMAIDNAQLYRRMERDAERLGREAKRWHTLNQAAVTVGGARGEQDVYDTITRALSGLGFSAVVLAFNPNAQNLIVVSAATPLPRLLRAIERLIGLSFLGFQFPLDQFEFYRRVVEQGTSGLVKLGAKHFAQWLPAPFTHLAQRITFRAGLDYGIAAPLKADGQTIALLVVAGSDLVSEDVPAITAFADQASAAIENARLFQAERRQREMAETLRDLVVTVNSTLDVDQVLNIAVRRLQVLHEATACSVSFLEEDRETFVFRATTDPGLDVSQRITFPARKSIAGRAIRECKVQVVGNVDLSPDYHAEIARRTGIVGRSLLTAPLFADDQPLGVIQILSASPNAFTQTDADLLATTAALIETAIARARTYAQAVQLAQAEHHQREVAETLRRVAILINASLDLDTVLERILEQLAQVIDYDSTSLMLLEGDKLRMRALRGFEDVDQVLQIVSHVADNPLFQEMVASLRPILIPDVRADDRYRHWAGSSPVRSWIGVPLVTRDRVIGQLAVDKHEPAFYDDADAELVLAFAHQAAIAIENARLHAETRRRLQEQIALREAGAAMSSTLELDTVLSRIAERMGQAIDATSAYIGDYKPETMTSTILAEYIGPHACAQEQVSDLGITYDLGQEFPGFVERIKTGRPVLVHLDDPDLPEAERAHMQQYGAQSVLTIPLHARGQMIAYADLWESRRRRDFTAEEIDHCQDIAHQAAVAIENAQLFHAEQSQRQMAEALRQAGAALSGTLDYEEVLDRILEQVSQVVPHDAANIMLIEGAVARVFRWRGYAQFGSEDYLASHAFRIADTFNLRTMQETGQPLAIPNIESKDDWIVSPEERWLRSYAGAPMCIRDRVVGFLGVESATTGCFSQADAERLQAFANQAAIAIENAQLFDSERRQREIAESLQEVATILNASLDLDTVLTRIMEQLRRVVEYDSAGVLLQDGDDLLISGGFGFPDPDTTIGLRVHLSSDAPGVRVFKHQRPLVIADVQADPTWIQMPGVEYIRGWMGVPLLAGEMPIGVLTVDSAKVGAYSKEDAEVVQSFADQATIAIENARLYQAERDRRQEIEVVQRASLSLTASLELPQVLDSILDATLDLVSAENAHIFLYTEGRLTFGAAQWADGRRGGPIAEPRPDGLTYSVARQGETIVVPDMRSHPLYASVPSDWSWAGAIVGLPLRIGQSVVGVMNVSRSEPGLFSEAELRALRLLADHAAIAIENARLFEAEQRQRQMAEALHRSALALTSTMALDQVFERILSELQNVVPYDSATVQLLKGDQLEIIGGRGFHKFPELLGVSFPAYGNNPNALVLESREPVIIGDVRPRYPAFSEEPHAAAAIRGWLGVPLLIGDRVIGMLALDKQLPDFYNEAHARIAVAYAAQAAIAIENARLHQALQDYAAELEARVEARTAEVNREHERLLAVLESAGEAIAIANADAVIEYANPAWEKLTGRDVAQVIQQKTRILDGETFPDLLVAVRSVAHPQRIWRREMTGQRPDGATYVVDLAVTPVFDDARKLVNLVAIYRDVTQYKELDRIKSEFLSTAAHQLRSPLTSILGFSELLLLREDLSVEDRARFLKHIYDHAIHLKQLVTNLLDISRMESGVSLAVELEPLDLYPLFEQEVHSWQEAHPDRTYRLDARRDWPQVRADRDRINQVMRNLLSNATEYSLSDSAIVVGATPVGGYMEVTVADEGIGMTSEEVARIFEKFWRADASSTAVEGTGLGLVIVKYIVEQHGGHIWVKSAKGKGTVVHFTLPVVERQTTVLIIEDEDSVREIEHRILANSGIATLLTSSGEQGIEMAQAHRPDLILLDLMMPGMSGQDVLQALKSDPATQHIPVLVVSARSGWQVIEESHMLGAVDFLTKPFEYQELLSRVRRALKVAAGSQQQAINSHLPPY